MRKTVFPKRSSPRKTTRIRFGKAGAHPQLALGIAIAPETLSHIYNLSILKAIAILPIFSQIFVVFHCAVLLFASQMWAARPHLGSIFEKLLHRKTFQLPAARISAAISKNLTVLVFFHKNFPIT
ncbi:MAG: hypothetical protein PUE88_06105 [Ruminococcus sp.]|nr:hypothetical protein [Ruminococcus sp.]